MYEYFTHTIATQCDRCSDSYICKNIDACDKSTWRLLMIYILQGDYGYRWEDLTAMREAKVNLDY